MLTVDLDGAETNLDKVVRVAEAAPGKLLNSTQVGRALQRSGAGTRLQSLRVAAQRALERNSDLFEPVAGRQATYRYLASGHGPYTGESRSVPDDGHHSDYQGED